MNANHILRVTPGTSLKKTEKSAVGGFMSMPRAARPENLSSLSSASAAQGIWSPCSNCSSDENNSPTALNSFHWDKPSLEDKSVDFGWTLQRDITNDQGTSSNTGTENTTARGNKRPLSSGYVNVPSRGDSKKEEDAPRPEPSTNEESAPTRQYLEIRNETSSACPKPRNPSLTDSACSPCEDLLDPVSIFDPRNARRAPPDSSSDSLFGSSSSLAQSDESSRGDEAQKEQEELRNAAWFQAGIPREIALEVLAGKPEGTFIVRESTTKPGCYALSLKTPPGHNSPSGIAHYLILHTPRGYKIKGFTKEFSTLGALITHHSVMQELLPCPLALPRYNNDRNASSRESDMEYVHTDQRCSLFSDIHWLMTDLEL